MKTILLISHSSNIGGGEEDFLKLLIYLHGKYEIFSIFPKGKNAELFKKYSDKFLEIKGFIFPFAKFSFVGYIKFILYNFKDIFNVNRFIKNNHKIDLCFLNSSVCFLSAIPVIFNNIPYVLSVKELINPFLVRKIIYFLYGKTVLKIISISKFLQNEIAKVTGRNDIDIIYSTLNSDYFKHVCKEIEGRPSLKKKDRFNIINIGHIYPLKGQHVLTETIIKLNGYNISVDFVGRIIDNGYYTRINDLIIKNNLSDKINFTGELAKDEVIEKIINSDCVIVTSEQEGQSLVILESLYLGKPVITTIVGVAPEIINDGENGMLYEYGNTDSLYIAIKKLIDDKNYYEKLRINCFPTYEKYFGSVNTVEKWGDIINNLIK